MIVILKNQIPRLEELLNFNQKEMERFKLLTLYSRIVKLVLGLD